jgi:hypothetical protein
MAEDELAELRAAAAPSTGVGICHLHPGREASFTCRRCGDNQCDECSRALEDGICPACVRSGDNKLAPAGQRVVLAFTGIWCSAQLWDSFRLWQRGLEQPGLLVFGLFSMVLGAFLLVAMHRGSSAAHHAWITWLGLGGLVNLIGGNLVAALPSLLFAGLLLSPAVSSYVATRGRDRPQ